MCIKFLLSQAPETLRCLDEVGVAPISGSRGGKRPVDGQRLLQIDENEMTLGTTLASRFLVPEDDA